jgi:hypothetical protein
LSEFDWDFVKLLCVGTAGRGWAVTALNEQRQPGRKGVAVKLNYGSGKSFESCFLDGDFLPELTSGRPFPDPLSRTAVMNRGIYYQK